MMKRLLSAFLVALLLVVGVSAQGSLSNQVLQLLSRVNTWIATQSFQDVRIVQATIPSVTTSRIYADLSGNLYYNGGLIAGSGGGVTPHNLLSTTHPDTAAASVVRGAIITGQGASPAWTELTIGASGSFLRSNGTDVSWGTDGSGLTNLTAANLAGTLAAVSGVNVTNLNASALASGTVPLAQLSGITNTQIAAAAGIVYSKLTLTGSVVNADLAAGTITNTAINASAAIAYSKLNLTGNILFTDWASNACSVNQIPKYTGTAWACAADANSGGSITSVAMTVPSILAISGSPITGSGTLALSLATETANTVLAGPTSGVATTPTFRALVNADFPTSGVVAGTFPKVTVNAQGIVTAGASAASLTADVSGILPMANGGTGLASASNSTVMVSSGTAWVAQALPLCTTGALNFNTATNAFSCSTTAAAHNILSASHGDSLTGTVVRGDLIVGNSTPKWARVALGTAGQLLESNGTDALWGNAVSGLTASTAGSGTLGSTATPFASIILGTAATNNLTISPAAFVAGVVATVSDPGVTAVKLPLVARGTIAYTAGALTAGTCSAAITATVTGLAGTAVVNASLNAAPGTQWQKGIYFLAYPTTNTVNIIVCNPTAGSITPDSSTFNYAAVLP